MRRALAVVSLAMALAGCHGQTIIDRIPSALDSSLIQIGVILPRTGPLASYGKGCEEGIHLWAQNQRDINLMFEDDQGDAQKSVEAFRRLEMRGVKAIVGPLTSTCALAVAPLADEAKLPLITPSASHYDVTKGHPYVYRMCFIDAMQGAAMASFAREKLGIERVAALLQKGEPYSRSLSESFRQAFHALGGMVICVEEYEQGTEDFGPILTRARDSGAEALFVPGFVHDVARLMKQARLAAPGMRLLGGDGWDSPELFAEAGPAAEGNFYTSQFSPTDKDDAVRAFVQTFRGKYGRDPGMFSALGYDAMLRIEGACGVRPVTRESIAQALSTVPSFRGVTGRMTFDEDHNPVKPVVILRTLSDRAVFETRVNYGLR